MKKIALLGALALSLMSPLALAEKPLRIGIEAAYPPFAFKTPDGQIAGFDYDIGNALCEEMKVECKWIEQEFDGLIPALKVRKFDAVLSSTSWKRTRALTRTGAGVRCRQKRNGNGPRAEGSSAPPTSGARSPTGRPRASGATSSASTCSG